MTDFIIALSVVFVVAGALLVIGNQLDLSPVPVYIVAGLIVGRVPFVSQGELLELALWGIAFLVFVFGIRVDLGDLQSVLRDGEGAAFAQLVIVAPIAFAVGYGLGEAFGFTDPFRNALYFAAAATLSSTLIGSQVIQQRIRSTLVHGRLASSIHFFDDMVAVGALLVLSAAVLTDTQLVTSKIGFGVVFLLTGLLVYRHGFALLVRAADGGDELVLMGSISILIAFLAAAEAAGISIVIGAFAAGLAIRQDSVGSLGVRNGIESIKDFFAAIFFVTVGALVAIPTVQVLVLASVLILLVVVVNPLIHTLAFVYEGYDGRTAFLTGSSLNQVSELSLVIAIQASLVTETIAGGLFDAIILAAAVTMLLSTVTDSYENAIYNSVIAPVFDGRTSHIDDHSRVSDDLGDHIVVVGYGRHGRQIVQTLETLDHPYVVIENDPVRLNDLHAECRNYVSGDAMAEYSVELARLQDATLVVSTVDYEPLSQYLLETTADVELILRANSSVDARELLDAGADFVVVPSVLASDQLVENVQRALGDAESTATLKQEHRELLRQLQRDSPELER